MKYLFLVLMGMIAISACGPAAKFRQDKAAFDASPVKHSFKSVADMNDAFFEIRENHFFEFYRQLFDSVKNSSYPGKYRLQNDTLILHFYNKTGQSLLGSKAILSADKKEIVFFK